MLNNVIFTLNIQQHIVLEKKNPDISKDILFKQQTNIAT